MRDRLRQLAGRGAGVHLLQVFDPAEEAFPYEGRLEFRDPETGATWLTERAGGLRSGYRERLAAHRALISELCAPGRLLLRRASHRPAGLRRACSSCRRGCPACFMARSTPASRGMAEAERPAA